jgi:short subunit dehydrogenase-like uncharacterized protein
VEQGRILIYGANGFTGELIAIEAARAGLRPILAGRRADAVAPIADRLGLEHRTFALDTPAALARSLDVPEVSTVLLAAGPFSATSAPMIEACLAARKHYLDITGEIEVFEAAFQRDDDARKRGCVVLPGVGFDVVPTDCLAAILKAALPDAKTLELAFAGGSRFSRGTAKTMLEGAPRGGAIREDGRIRRVRTAWKTREVPFRDRQRLAVTIPWGDVATAYRSTGIPNIAVYLAASPRMLKSMRRARWIAPLVRLGPVRRWLERRIDRRVRGPDEATRQKTRVQVWGRVASDSGRAFEATLETPEGYQFTAMAAVECARRVAGGVVLPGATTPSLAFGPRFVTELPGCILDEPHPAGAL